jgi:signal transduction histidine kinase
MATLRRRFLLVAAAVLLPVTLLVWRALASLAAERRLRHEVVAERLFDEMERALSDLLAEEELRPFLDYATEPPDPRGFVRGRFQVDPDGRIQAGDDAVRAAVTPLWRGGDLAKAPAGAAQPPGSTVELWGPEAGDDDAAAPAPVATGNERKQVAAAKETSAYDALRSLNKAVEQRAARQRNPSEDARGDIASRVAEERPRIAAAPAPEGGRRKTRPPDLPPMAGRRLDPTRLVLYRTVVRDGRSFRQGLLVDVPALGAWLRDQTLGGGELAAFATLQFGEAAPARGRGVAPAFVYGHRFAEPFADLTALLALRPLPGAGGASYVRALAALLVLAVVLGLTALYRMVAVAVGFAERRSNFVAAVSHELKTPLTAIRMYGEMLRDGIVTSDAKRDEYHRHITAESERLSRLINNVLEFSKLEKKARPMMLADVPLAPVLAETAALLDTHATRAGFRLRVAAAPELPPVRCDRDALLQILFNLVDNAVKYAAASERKTIELAASVDGGRVVLTVRDHGPGVPAAELARVFEPFHRGERELTRQHQGVGLGLALVRGLAEGMGATVSAANAPDGGFQVRVAFPGARIQSKR